MFLYSFVINRRCKKVLVVVKLIIDFIVVVGCVCVGGFAVAVVVSSRDIFLVFCSGLVGGGGDVGELF